MERIETDFLVIGSGIAGLWYAYRAARRGRVLVVTKKSDTDSNTNYAQGGIAAAFGPDDSPDLHIQDTIRAGEGLAHEEVVRVVAYQGPALVTELNELGVAFDTYRDASGAVHFQLGREGGHLRSRIVHARDYTGQVVENGLVRAVKAQSSVQVLENHFVLDLILDGDGSCAGCWMIEEDTHQITEVRAGQTLLATGGIGQVYSVTTNPPIATGDGIALAYRAGARIADMEFIQFHPTALYGHSLDGRAFLISESVRGEGGVLKTQDGQTFMEHYHELANLAPRDVVARAINSELKRRREDYVLLDVSHLDPSRVRARFPTIYEQCRRFGIDITTQPIPVVPAAHYVCGGVQTDVNGRTSIPRLFAAGECACSGLHGANRLASNSLLEALVLADRAAAIAAPWPGSGPAAGPGEGSGRAGWQESAVHAPHNRDWDRTLAVLMSEHVAIVRDDRGLEQAWQELRRLMSQAEERALNNPDIAAQEFRNKVTVARLIVYSARQRRESRGLHYNRDYPGRDDVHYRRNTVVTRQELEKVPC